jgi:hypothetical protein
MRSGWLLRDGDVVCALDMAETSGERRVLRERSGLDGAIYVEGVRSLHTAGMKFPIDVAFLSDDHTVVRVAHLRPWRLALGGRGVHSAVAMGAGSLERWGVQVGDQLELREARPGANGSS